MNGIGGYFELELSPTKQLFYPTYFAVNTCRNALLLLIQSKKYTKILLPLYSCKVITEMLDKNNISFEYYKIDKKFEIIGPLKNKDNEAILYTNYFGIKNKENKILEIKGRNLIIDNAQAFFSNPVNNVDTIYSPRKFFGVPDGGYLFTKSPINLAIYPQDTSNSRCSHLLKRIELNSENGYSDFIENEMILSELPIMKMSNLTQSLLSQIDYEIVKKKRQENFAFVDNVLRKSNLLIIDNFPKSTCMVYPYLISDGDKIKQKLIENRIYIATYWPAVLERTSSDSFEYFLTKNLIPIPIDQRYGENELQFILNLLK